MTTPPKFSMTSDSTEPDITGCLAKWESSDRTVQMHFETGAHAFLMNSIVTDAFKAGVEAGRADVVHDVTSALNAYRT